MESVKGIFMNNTDIANATDKVQKAIDAFNANLAIWQIQMSRQIRKDFQAAVNEDKMNKVTNWLSSRNEWARHEAIIKRRVPNTGLWIMEREEFRSWLAQPSQPLLCYGNGKQHYRLRNN